MQLRSKGTPLKFLREFCHFKISTQRTLLFLNSKCDYFALYLKLLNLDLLNSTGLHGMGTLKALLRRTMNFSDFING